MPIAELRVRGRIAQESSGRAALATDQGIGVFYEAEQVHGQRTIWRALSGL